MKAFPHTYPVDATLNREGPVTISSHGLPSLASAPPEEFGGPGDQWSPETLLVAAVADCFALTFRAIASASKLDWTHLECHADGLLDRVDGVTRFTQVVTKAELAIPRGSDAERARKLLEKAERVCLVTNSLKCECRLEAEVVVRDAS